MSDAPLYKTDIKSLPFLHRGKVRDIYAVGDDKLLVVQSDRLSAFDVILDDPIPGKGRVLTELSYFWFDKLKHIIPNHLTGIDPATVVAPEERAQIAGRAMVVHKYKPLMVEAVVRGYIIGSGWRTTRPVVCASPPAEQRKNRRLPPASKSLVVTRDMAAN
jgi:phosphoribosylaminoimidazole-succinocarboxamide synthase